MFLNEIKITALINNIRLCTNVKVTLAHFVGIEDNGAFFILPEYFIQGENRYAQRIDHIGKNIAGTYRWKLGYITHHNQGGRHGDRLNQMIHQNRVHHGGFIDNDRIGVKGVVPVSDEAAICKIVA